METPVSEAATICRPIDEADEDDSETDLDRFQKFIVHSSVQKRVVAMRNLVSTCKTCGFNSAVQDMFPLLDHVTADSESTVREALANQIAPTIDFILEGGGEHPELVANTIISVAFKLLKDIDPQVRTATEDAIVEFVPKLAKVAREMIEAPILTSVLYMAHEDEHEEQRITAVKLLGELASSYGAELCMQFAAPEAVSLAADPMFRVRKAAAMYIGKIAIVAPKDFAVERMLPVFFKLSQDEIWGVRKACAESLPDMVSAFPNNQELIDLFEKFAEDTSRWVRTSAFTRLGPLIANLPQDQISKRLIELFSTMTAPNFVGPGESEIPTHCAFNFPAVVVAVGRDRWPELKDTFAELVKDIQWKVRRTLAFSIHEIARTLGAEISRECLVPAIDVFLKDLDEVKIGALQHLVEFLEVLEADDRADFIPVLSELEMDTDNWRFRAILASQISRLCGLYGIEVLQDEFLPMLIRFIQDPVAEIRATAAQQMCGFLRRLSALNAEWRNDAIAEICEFSAEPSYQGRLVFVLSCESVLDDFETFKNHFFQPLLSLVSDPVPNVRLRVARVLVKLPLDLASEAAPALATLKLDRDKEVRITAGGSPEKPSA